MIIVYSCKDIYNLSYQDQARRYHYHWLRSYKIKKRNAVVHMDFLYARGSDEKDLKHVLVVNDDLVAYYLQIPYYRPDSLAATNVPAK